MAIDLWVAVGQCGQGLVAHGIPGHRDNNDNITCWVMSWAHLPLDKNGHHFASDIFRCIFVNEKFCILTQISLKFVPKGPIDNKQALV